MRARFKISALILLFLFILPATTVFASKPVKIALSKNPPIVFTDEAGKPAGIYVDIINYT